MNHVYLFEFLVIAMLVRWLTRQRIKFVVIRGLKYKQIYFNLVSVQG